MVKGDHGFNQGRARRPRVPRECTKAPRGRRRRAPRGEWGRRRGGKRGKLCCESCGLLQPRPRQKQGPLRTIGLTPRLTVGGVAGNAAGGATGC
eukprot:2864552-Pleurochrysis_carterae.AAC.1